MNCGKKGSVSLTRLITSEKTVVCGGTSLQQWRDQQRKTVLPRPTVSVAGWKLPGETELLELLCMFPILEKAFLSCSLSLCKGPGDYQWVKMFCKPFMTPLNISVSVCLVEGLIYSARVSKWEFWGHNLNYFGEILYQRRKYNDLL